jgi:hypothetical protein
MLDSNGYNNGSERVEEDLSCLLMGDGGSVGNSITAVYDVVFEDIITTTVS